MYSWKVLRLSVRVFHYEHEDYKTTVLPTRYRLRRQKTFGQYRLVLAVDCFHFYTRQDDCLAMHLADMFGRKQQLTVYERVVHCP